MNTHQARPNWQHYDHRADIGIRGIGSTLTEAFENAALAMTAVIVDPDLVQALETIKITCEEDDPELLFVDWLNSIIYLMATRSMLFSRFSVQIEGSQLHASIQGEPLDRKRHQPTVEIKGATYTTLRVEQTANGNWIAQTVVDV